MQCKEIHELTILLRERGDEILDASSKLSLSSNLICKMNESFTNIISYADSYTSSFEVLTNGNSRLGQFLDLQLLYDFVQKTLALKIFPGTYIISSQIVDINLFRNLKLLEVHRFSLNLLKGLKNLRTQLEYLTCTRSVKTLREVLESCGADNSHGYIWNELKELVFSHNGLNNIDTSLEFVPQLKSIDLSHNFIQDVQPVNCLLNLKNLNLGFNQIENIPAFFGPLCSELQVLILCNNYIEDIKELSVLIKLHELDLSNNCLIEHNCLTPLTSLTSLQRLSLNGNPLSYHPQHRSRTVRYLHINTSVCFILDSSALSKSELRLVGSLHPTFVSLERSQSFNSNTTTNTIVPCESNQSVPQALDQNFTSNIEANNFSNNNRVSQDISQEHSEHLWLQNENVDEECHCMQDSGFVAGPRPVSPSECSIGSATSLDEHNRSNNHTIRYCESDIEVLSNPSQSSIEVLSNRSDPRYIQSASAILTQPTNEFRTKSDLKGLTDEMHRSF